MHISRYTHTRFLMHGQRMYTHTHGVAGKRYVHMHMHMHMHMHIRALICMCVSTYLSVCAV